MAYKQTTYTNKVGNKNYSNYGYTYAVGKNNATNANGGSGTYSPGNPAPSSSSKVTTPSSPSSGSSGSSSGGSSSKSSGSSSSSTPSASATGYTGYWNSDGLIDLYMKKLNQQAENAYNRNMGALNEYYNSAKNNLQNNYNESVGVLDRNNAQNTNSINADAEASMRQAYINNMLSRKSLQQAMTAQGLNGGATETTRASMENNYGNARNNIDTTRNRNLADLMTQYQNNLAGLRQQYNSGLSELDTNKMNYSMTLNDRLQDMLDNYADKVYSATKDYEKLYNSNAANGETTEQAMARLDKLYAIDDMVKSGIGAFDKYNLGGASNIGSVTNDYLNNLQNIAAASQYFSMNPTEAENYYNPVSMEQAGMYANSNYARALAAQEALGATSPEAFNTAISQYNNISSLQEILRQLGYM